MSPDPDPSSVTTGNPRPALHLYLYFLAPLSLVLAAISGLFVAQMYLHQRAMLSEDLGRMQRSLSEIYDGTIYAHKHLLDAVMESMAYDRQLRNALATKDREALFRITRPLFAQLNGKYEITHLYFFDEHGRAILRFSYATFFNDTTGRATPGSLMADQTRAWGTDLGPLDMLTLRVVRPWFRDPAGKTGLIGYAELGIKVGHILGGLHAALGGHLSVYLRKKYLQRKSWEQGMLMADQAPRWDRFANAVQVAEVGGPLPGEVDDRLATMTNDEHARAFEVSTPSETFNAASRPLFDAAGRHVGTLFYTVNTTGKGNAFRDAMFLVGSVAVASGISLIVVFWILIGRITRQLTIFHARLQELATHDGLTGLFNHRMLYTNLATELERARRYPQPLAVMMIDIDRFKQINDAHGHLCGDRVLAELSRRVIRAGRVTDTVYRYGGEEIMMVLPQTTLDEALVVGERVRTTIADVPFPLGHGAAITVSVSVGVAVFPDHAKTIDDLISCADYALYEAKNSGRNQVTAYTDTQAN